MKLLIDADYLLEVMVNRPSFQEITDLIKQELELDNFDFFVTEAGLEKVLSIVTIFAESKEKAAAVSQLIIELIGVVRVESEDLQLARKSPLKDFESAIELISAEKHEMIAIVTHQPDNFTGLENNIVEIWTPDKIKAEGAFFPSYLRDLLTLLSVTPNSKSWELLATVFCDDTADDEFKLLLNIKELEEKSLVVEIEPQRYVLNSIGAGLSQFNIKAFNLKNNLAGNQKLIDKFLSFYITLAKQNGGLEWGNWHEQYDILDKEWGNLKSALEFCLEYKMEDSLEELWDSVNHFADLYSYNDDRVKWLNYLIEISRKNENWDRYVMQLSRQAWTQIIFDRQDTLRIAGDLLTQTNEYLERSSINTQYYSAHVSFVYHIHQKEYERSEQSLKKQESLLGLLEKSNVDEKMLIRHTINLFRNKAKLAYVQNNLDVAQSIFEDVLEKARQIEWLRGVSYTLNKLADVALDQKELEKAKRYLDEGYIIATNNNNKRRIAGYAKSSARLAKMLGNECKFNEWAELAYNTFESIDQNERAKRVREELKLVTCLQNGRS